MGICVRCGGRSSRCSGSSAAFTAAGTSLFSESKPDSGMGPDPAPAVALEAVRGSVAGALEPT